jgi:glycerol uptake facilitator-like aquaporin
MVQEALGAFITVLFFMI